jgi:hypothetical protein
MVIALKRKKSVTKVKKPHVAKVRKVRAPTAKKAHVIKPKAPKKPKKPKKAHVIKAVHKSAAAKRTKQVASKLQRQDRSKM